MIHLRLRTEYSFRKAFGSPEKVLEAAGGNAAAITDNGTWGHVAWSKACKKRGIKPIFGVELFVCKDARDRVKQGGTNMAFLARNNDGLEELYQLVTRANDLFYYFPRIDYRDVNALTSNVIVLSGSGADLERLQPKVNVYLELNPSNQNWNRTVDKARGWQRVVCCNNSFPTTADRPCYEIVAGERNRDLRTSIMHIADEDELRLAIPQATDDDFLNTERIALDCNAEMPRAEMVKPERSESLYDLCIQGAMKRGIQCALFGPTKSQHIATVIVDEKYRMRMNRELEIIKEKNFEDYFYLITEIVRDAKTKMFVGPARGSSGGSLVCYLLGITDINPLQHGLIFERFIDITRPDLPDVDIDFPDDKRELVLQSLQQKYGITRVGKVGTISRYKGRSVLGDLAKQLNIPAWEMKDVKDSADMFGVETALTIQEHGRQLLEKYPGLRLALELEDHATHSGTHAAGIIVTDKPLSKFCAVNKDGTAQVDKKDAEVLGMLKIDALGLRTLSVIDDCLNSIGKTREWILSLPLDDAKAFDILNQEKFSGIFQFEGKAMQNVTRQMKVHSFEDISALSSLARPGPLHCGSTSEFVERRTGKAPVTHLHELVAPITEETFGVIVYQEQVMRICREVGGMDWYSVSEVRRGMGKTLGPEFLAPYWEKFKEGCIAKGMEIAQARRIWDKMETFGSYAFNKSHSVAYAYISYWCAYLKAYFPLEFSAACLRNAKDEEQSVGLLRELRNEGMEFKPVDVQRSTLNWSVIDGVLVGGLVNIKGLGAKKAQDILIRRREGRPLQPGQVKLLADPKTPFDDIFEATRRFSSIYKSPESFNIHSAPVSLINDMHDEADYVFIGKIRSMELRDMNDAQSLLKRGGKRINRSSLYIMLELEDDSGSIKARIERDKYARWGKPLIDSAKVGDWYLWKGKIRDESWRTVSITRWRSLNDQTAQQQTEERQIA
jgi:DNA polymerase III alpha subunit